MTDLRVGDSERDAAAADLAEHVALGRLTPEEHAERLDAVWSARTRADLDVLFHDLPQAAPWAEPRRRTGWRPVPFVPIVLVLVLLSALTHLPLWLAAFAVGGVCFARARRTPVARLRT